MRLPYKNQYFSAVFNLFTSLGYFENPDDNLNVFRSAHAALVDGGIFIIDFFNSEIVCTQIKEHYEVKTENILFRINKKLFQKTICKEIEFDIDNKQYKFIEKVSLLNESDFIEYATNTNFTLVEKFGDYQLNSFDSKNSERLIMIFKK